MRKVLLSAAAVLASSAMFAQIDYSAQVPESDSKIMKDSADVYKVWTASKRNLFPNPVSLVTLNFEDPILAPTATDAKADMWWWEKAGGKATDGTEADRFNVSYNATEKALQIDLNIDPTADNWGAANLEWGTPMFSDKDEEWKTFNPFHSNEGNDTIVGYFVDLTDKAARQATVHFKIETKGFTGDSVNMRMDLGDANGRLSNHKTPHHAIRTTTANEKVTRNDMKNGKSAYDGYLTQTFNWAKGTTEPFMYGNNGDGGWNEDVYCIADEYSGDVWNTKFRADTAKFPYSLTGGKVIDLDKRFICKIGLGFNDAQKSAGAGTQANFTVYIKKIVLGNPMEENFDLTPTFDPNYVKTPAKDPKVAKVTPTVGKKFSFEGDGVMTSIHGVVVAKGTNGIDASNLATGTYFITINGVGTQVSVQ